MPEHDPSLRGPHPVGVIQTRISSAADPIDPERTLPTDIWYPAHPGVRERDDGEHPLGLPHRATRNVTPLPDATLPLVVFSHGNSGLRQQSTFLMTHLASHGFVVAAPDHVGNTFGEMVSLETDEERREVHLRARRQRPHDVARVISALLDEGLEAVRRPTIDPGRIGVAGHSYGGWTALKVAAHEPRVRSVCCLAPAAEPFVGRRAFEEGELPLSSQVAALVIAAEDDVLVDRHDTIEPLVARVGDHARLEWLDRADHFHFCDGVELLHKVHENTPRPSLPRPPRPFAELRGEKETHPWLNERIARFFLDALAVEDVAAKTGDTAA